MANRDKPAPAEEEQQPKREPVYGMPALSLAIPLAPFMARYSQANTVSEKRAVLNDAAQEYPEECKVSTWFALKKSAMLAPVLQEPTIGHRKGRHRSGDVEVKLICKLANETGNNWKEVAARFEDETGTTKTPEACRKIFYRAQKCGHK